MWMWNDLLQWNFLTSKAFKWSQKKLDFKTTVQKNSINYWLKAVHSILIGNKSTAQWFPWKIVEWTCTQKYIFEILTHFGLLHVILRPTFCKAQKWLKQFDFHVYVKPRNFCWDLHYFGWELLQESRMLSIPEIKISLCILTWQRNRFILKLLYNSHTQNTEFLPKFIPQTIIHYPVIIIEIKEWRLNICTTSANIRHRMFANRSVPYVCSGHRLISPNP